jgi:biopolymer transport protein ExbD
MKADINVTPLIDVLLVLLIIFMLVTPGAPTAVEASLPEAARDDARSSTGLLLAVEKDGWLVNGVPMASAAQLESRLRDDLENRRDRTLFVRVGEGVPYSRVIEALDVARGCGASRIGLVDEQGERTTSADLARPAR